MQRVIDLSGKLENGMWGYHELPGLEKVVPRVEISTIATISRNAFFSSKMTLSTISGTYLEAGAHMLEGGKCLDEYDPGDFMKPAKVIRLPRQNERSLIDGALLEAHAQKIERGDALLIDCGWGRMWDRPGYVLGCPNMVKSAIDWVLAKDISIFGVDVPCIESAWSMDQAGEKGGMLSEIFKRGILLVAPLVNMDTIRKTEGRLICLPLSVKGTSGAPARVLFIEEA